MLNLNETADIHYRYKMPKIESITQSSGNGIKTALLNLTKVARAISRPPIYVAKFMAFELGCICKPGENPDTYILMGQHENERLQTLIYSFIKKFVLCPSCNNPETATIVAGTVKKPTVSLLCSACGAGTLLANKHKLYTYIVKNPPSEEYNPVTHGVDETALKSNDLQAAGENQTSANGTNDKHSSDEEPIEIDPSRKADLDKELKILLEKNKKESLEQKLEKFEDSLRPHLSLINDTASQFEASLIKGLASYAIELGVFSASAIVLARNIFKRTSSDSSQDLKTYINSNWLKILTMFLSNNVPTQLNFLAGIEEILCIPRKLPFNLKSLPNMSLLLFQQDLITEEAFNTWFNRLNESTNEGKNDLNKELSKQLVDLMRPFIDWLNQSSDEDSGCESSEEEPNNESKSQPNIQNNNDKNMNNGNANIKPTDDDDGDDESDIDVDDL